MKSESRNSFCTFSIVQLLVLSSTIHCRAAVLDKPNSASLPPIFAAAQGCDDAKFAELFKKDISAVHKTLYDMNWGRDGDDRYAEDKFKNRFFNYTLLDVAAANGCTNIIQQLLEMEANVNPPLISPLGLAAGNGHSEAVKMLLKAKANPEAALAAAVKNGDVAILNTLIEAGASGSEKLLKEPVAKGQLEMVKVLLKLKKTPGETDEYGFTRREAFRNAIEKGNLDIVKAFVTADEEVSDARDEDDKKMMRDTLVQTAINANQADVVAYLKQAKKSQANELAERKAAKEKVASVQKKEEEAKLASASDALNKKLQDALNNPEDAFGLAGTRYRKFNGKLYDCSEPIEFLNKLITFNAISDQYPNQEGFLKQTAKQLQTNQWLKVANNCSLWAVLVKQVTPDGLIVRLNSPADQEVLVFLKNHPNQAKFVDGDVMAVRLFALKTSPYHYTGVLGAEHTIPAYDFGVVVPAPSGSVDKIPLPADSQ